MNFNTVTSFFAVILSIQEFSCFVEAKDEEGRRLSLFEVNEFTNMDNWYQCETCGAGRTLYDYRPYSEATSHTEATSYGEPTSSTKATSTSTKASSSTSTSTTTTTTTTTATTSTSSTTTCYKYLCIYSSVAEDVKMTPSQQRCYGEEYPPMTAGHAAIMLVDTCTKPPTKTTWGNWPDSVEDNGDESDIRENYCGDKWTKEDYPFIFCHAISADEEATLRNLVAADTEWTYWHNCASFASETFHGVTGIDIDADEILGFESPREVGEHIIEANHGTNTPVPMPF